MHWIDSALQVVRVPQKLKRVKYFLISLDSNWELRKNTELRGRCMEFENRDIYSVMILLIL